MFLSDDLIRLASTGYLGSKSITAFQNDLFKLKSIKRQLIRYDKTQRINVRLLLNNVILFFNCFNTSIGKQVMFSFFTSDKHKSIVKTCLIHLNLMDECEHTDITIHPYFDTEIRIIIFPQ